MGKQKQKSYLTGLMSAKQPRMNEKETSWSNINTGQQRVFPKMLDSKVLNTYENTYHSSNIPKLSKG